MAQRRLEGTAATTAMAMAQFSSWRYVPSQCRRTALFSSPRNSGVTPSASLDHAESEPVAGTARGAMTALREVRRLAVGTPTGRRSTVWTFSVHKSEIYILSRMFGSDSKVSLHSTGDCQWSATDTWVKKAPGRRNADRHIMKWVMPRPNGTAALHAFPRDRATRGRHNREPKRRRMVARSTRGSHSIA
jgi:hypothetical protein